MRKAFLELARFEEDSAARGRKRSQERTKVNREATPKPKRALRDIAGGG
jgi:hypothetical protein